MTDQQAKIEERLSRLERHNRNLKLILVAVVAGVAVACSSDEEVISQEEKPAPKVIQAEQFQVVNKAGQVVWAAEADEDGDGFTYIQNKAGQQVWFAAVGFEGGDGVTGLLNNAGKAAWGAP